MQCQLVWTSFLIIVGIQGMNNFEWFFALPQDSYLVKVKSNLSQNQAVYIIFQFTIIFNISKIYDEYIFLLYI